MNTLAQLLDSIAIRQPERVNTLRDGRTGLRGGLTCEVKTVEGEAATLDFIASDESLDRYGEVILQSGWQLANYLANPVVVDSHNYRSIANILGSSTRVWVEGGALRNRVRFALDNPLGALAFKLAAGGFIRSESVGFIPLEWKDGTKVGDPYRTYIESELIEISLVAVPANPGATVGLALQKGLVTGAEVRDVAELLNTLCSDSATPGGNSSAKAPVGDVAQLLTLARECAALARRA